MDNTKFACVSKPIYASDHRTVIGHTKVRPYPKRVGHLEEDLVEILGSLPAAFAFVEGALDVRYRATDRPRTNGTGKTRARNFTIVDGEIVRS